MLQTRKLRSELNALLQPCTTVREIKERGKAFGEKYGDSIWGCMGLYSHETFGSLYNEHLSRCVENEQDEERRAARMLGIHIEIADCYNLSTFRDVRAFVEKHFPDDAQVLWELSEKGQELGHEEYLDGGLP